MWPQEKKTLGGGEGQLRDGHLIRSDTTPSVARWGRASLRLWWLRGGRGRWRRWLLLLLRLLPIAVVATNSAATSAWSHPRVHGVRSLATHHLVAVHQGPDLALGSVSAEEVAQKVHWGLLGVGILALLRQLDERTCQPLKLSNRLATLADDAPHLVGRHENLHPQGAIRIAHTALVANFVEDHALCPPLALWSSNNRDLSLVSISRVILVWLSNLDGGSRDHDHVADAASARADDGPHSRVGDVQADQLPLHPPTTRES